jgi:transcriptional regulator with XRE-family HTH domain
MTEPNTAFRAVRQGMRMSQDEMARAVRQAGDRAGEPNDCTKRLIQRWEAGLTSTPRGTYIRALEAVTGQPAENLGFKQAQDAYQPGRRQVIGMAAAAAVIPVTESKSAAQGPLTGIWRSRYSYPSSSRGKTYTSEHHVIVLQHGARLQVRSLRGSGQGDIVMDLSVEAGVATGTWTEDTDQGGYYRGARYSGAIQLLIEPSGHRMAGQWVGYGRSFDVNTGPWQLDLVSADTSKQFLERYSSPPVPADA